MLALLYSLYSLSSPLASTLTPSVRVPLTQYSSRFFPHIIISAPLLPTTQSWPLHSQYPNGHIVRIIGDPTDFHIAVESILLQNNLFPSHFSVEALACLPRIKKDNRKEFDTPAIACISAPAPGTSPTVFISLVFCTESCVNVLCCSRQWSSANFYKELPHRAE